MASTTVFAVLACILAAGVAIEAGMNDILAKLSHAIGDQSDASPDSPPSTTTANIEPPILRVSSIALEPYAGLDRATGRIRGLEIDLVRTLADRMGRRVAFELSDNRTMLLQKLAERFVVI